MNSFLNPIVEEVTTKFRKTNALSKETSKGLAEIGIFPQEKPEHKLAFNYLKSMWYVRKYKGNFYLDENAIVHPLKTLYKKFLFVFSLAFPLMIVIFGIISLLIQFRII